mgnify:CR=1 FL=1
MELSLDRLTKQYGRKIAVDCVSATLKPGVYGLLGANGAGKTTLMRMLCAVLESTSGEVLLDGKEITSMGADYRNVLGYLPQDFGYYPNYTAVEFLMYIAALKGIPKNVAKKRVTELLEVVDLSHVANKKVKTFSGGMKQRVGIAQALLNNPKILILDEPINGLDPIGIAEVRSFIRELCDARGKTILISSHILSEISLLADDIGIIDHGALLEEESLAELEQKSSKHIRFTLSDTAQAARILERNFHENHFSIQDDHNLRLHNLDLPVGKIVTAFVENGLEVSEAHTCEESLEDYFKRVTGGEGIA